MEYLDNPLCQKQCKQLLALLDKRFIGGGRKKVRKALFMTTVSFCQFDGMAKAMKQALIDKGKPWKVAITAIMRHLLILLNEIIKSPNFVLKSTP